MSVKYTVPEYVSIHRKDIDKSPPGHRFLLYFQTCGENWAKLDSEKRDALKSVISKGAFEDKLVSNLVARQKDWSIMDSHLVIYAKTTAPIATGLGNPHPVENGFAFLSPYGIPYLAGSSVKGVVRRAAEELALFVPESGWTIPLVWALFGFETGSAYLSSAHDDAPGPLIEESMRWMASFANWVKETADNDQLLRNWLEIASPINIGEVVVPPCELLTSWLGKKGERVRREVIWKGMLNFWDVFPETNNGLAVDILNPHHKDYYEGNSTPNDAETPKPVFFLTISPGASCTFICEMPTVADEKRRKVFDAVGDWKTLMTKAYEHAFDWLGFGAKTSVGYGAMERDPKAEARLEKEMQYREAVRMVEAAKKLKEEEERVRQQAENDRLAALSPFDRSIEEAIRNDADQNKKTYLKLLDALKVGRWSGGDVRVVAEKVRDMMIKDGEWVENPDPNKAKKDKAVKRTLEVMKYI